MHDYPLLGLFFTILWFFLWMREHELHQEARREQVRQDYIRSVVNKPVA